MMNQEVLTPLNRKVQKQFLKELPVDYLTRGRYQPRQTFAEESLRGLAETIKKVGILEPLVVRLISDKKYEIIAGERRWRAAQIAGLETVPCLIGAYSDEQASHIALIENIARENLNVIEEAQSILRVIEEFGYTHEEIAAILGKPRTHITNLLRLLKLDARIQNFLKEGKLTEAHGKILAGVAYEKQYPLALTCVQKQISTKSLTAMVKEINNLNNVNTFLKPQKKDVNILKLEQQLSDKLGYPVKIESIQNKYFLSIECRDLDQMEGVLQRLGYESK